MKNQVKSLLILSFIFILTGCVVRTYPLTKERVDQDLTTGNRGYLKGRPLMEEVKERKTSRTTQIVEIEMFPPMKFEKKPKEKTKERLPVSYIPEAAQVKEPPAPLPVANIEKYVVQEGDTLQKISRKFYGTTKKWIKIYEANKDKLKAPDRIYPGQTIDIPIEPQKETKENLK